MPNMTVRLSDSEFNYLKDWVHENKIDSRQEVTRMAILDKIGYKCDAALAEPGPSTEPTEPTEPADQPSNEGTTENTQDKEDPKYQQYQEPKGLTGQQLRDIAERAITRSTNEI